MSVSSKISSILYVCLIFCIAGCGSFAPAKLNEGVVDYRTVPPNASLDALKLVDRFRMGNDIGDTVINPGNRIMITVQQVFIADFFECHTSGEIAIVGRATELGKGTKISFTKEASESGRVVYYSDDVLKSDGERKGQYLSFTSLPLYGSVTYQGGPFLIELYIIEMDDEESAQYREVVKTLASIGGSAYPPASPVLGVLESIGTALLSGAQNDLEFRYYCALYPFRGSNNVPHSYLHEGNYVFVKKDHPRKTRFISGMQSEATQPVPWKDLTFNPKTGRLLKDGSDYRGHTYITLRVTKRQDSFDADLANNYFTLGEMIQTMLKKDEAKVGTITDALGDITKLIETREDFKKSQTQIKAVRTNEYGTEGKNTTVNNLLTTLHREVTGNDDERKFENDQLNDLLMQLKSALPEDKQPLVSKDLFNKPDVTVEEIKTTLGLK